MRFGIYIHFPWCRNRCPYCDFAIAVSAEEPPHQAYADAVLAELAVMAPRFEGRELVSVYFGGGTPSLWDPACLAQIVEACCERFGASAAALEISLECNPTDCSDAAFAGWKQAGINRVLVGVQATSAADLVTLGRDHRMGDGRRGLERTLSAGFASVGADLILGVPGSAEELASVTELARIGPPHLSVYELTIEERTPLARSVARGELIPESDERLAELYLAAHEQLGAAGYEHYEVSSYARPGHRARHNSLYWTGGEYLGLGNGAASFWRDPAGGGERWQNHRSVGRYRASSPEERVASRERIGVSELATELLWLAMRTVDGAPKEAFTGRWDVVDQLMQSDLLVQRGGRISPTIQGFLYNNQVIHRLAGA
jgi:oxygen-independent coproporphyrinogen-3 oxidase